MDCVAPPSKGGDAIHQCPRADSWLLRAIFDHGPLGCVAISNVADVLAPLALKPVSVPSSEAATVKTRV